MNTKMTLAAAALACTTAFSATAQKAETTAPEFTPEELETITFVKNFNECMATGDNDPDRAAQIQAYDAEVKRVEEHNRFVRRQFNADSTKYNEAHEQYMWESPMVEREIELETKAYDFPTYSTSRMLLLRQASAIRNQIIKDFEQTSGLTLPDEINYDFQKVTLPKPINLDEHCTLKYAKGQVTTETQRSWRRSLMYDITDIIEIHGGKSYMDAIGMEILPTPTPE